jgi:hypothetical protein
MNSQKSLGARSEECGGCVMTGIAAQQAMCGSVRYRDAETTHCPCLPLVTPLPLQNLHVEMISNILSNRYELTVPQTVDVKEFWELFDYPSAGEEGFKLGEAWNPSTSLLKHSSIHTLRISREETRRCGEENKIR